MQDAPPGRTMSAKPRDGADRDCIHEVIAHRLGVMIVSDHYQPGDLLDNESTLSEQLKFRAPPTARRDVYCGPRGW